MKEIYKGIPNYIGYYEVSNLGNVRSLDRDYIRKDGRKGSVKGIIKKQRVGTSGYYIVDLKVDGVSKTFRCHKLVAQAFLNHIPNGHIEVVDHIDDNKLNNNVNNLQLLTNRENTSKTKRKNSTSKYTGVHLNRQSNKFHATIRIDGDKVYLGSFNDEYDAHLAYQKKLKTL